MDGIKGNIGDSESAQRRLNEQIKQLITQKIQLEAKEKRLVGEVDDLKKKNWVMKMKELVHLINKEIN